MSNGFAVNNNINSINLNRQQYYLLNNTSINGMNAIQGINNSHFNPTTSGGFNNQKFNSLTQTQTQEQQQSTILRLSVLLEKSKWFNLYKKSKRKKCHDKHDRGSDDKEIINMNLDQDSNLYYSGDIPNKRWGHTANVYNNHIVVFGGRHNYKSLNSMHVFDISTYNWTKLDPSCSLVPCARDSHASLVYKDKLLVYGGNWQGKKLNDFWRFNFIDKT